MKKTTATISVATGMAVPHTIEVTIAERPTPEAVGRYWALVNEVAASERRECNLTREEIRAIIAAAGRTPFAFSIDVEDQIFDQPSARRRRGGDIEHLPARGRLTF
jgi:hypothetical protein